VIFDGLDDVSGQRMTIRQAYGFADLRIGHIFADILTPSETEGPPEIDYRKIHDTLDVGDL
jgi:hypothetical protein